MNTGTSGSVSEHDERPSRVDRADPAEHGERDDAREHDLRQVAGEVRLEAVHALDAGRHDLCASDAVECGRLRPQPPRDELDPKLGQHVRRRSAARDLEGPREQPPAPRRRAASSATSGATAPSGGAVERARDDPREQRRLHQHQQRRRDPEPDIDAEQHAHRPGAADEARVERAHG